MVKLSAEEMRKKRTDMQIIFQDPFSSLNPRKTISQIIADPLKINKIITDKNEQMDRVRELMETVGLADRLINTYPHELDGGRRQRIGIARALALNPKFIVCDEPVSALDVSIQAQILNLMKQLQSKMGLTYMFITHDLSVVNHFSDDIAVMYLGKLIEKAPSEELFAHPTHPYTQALLSAIPIPSLDNRRERILLKGEITSPIERRRHAVLRTGARMRRTAAAQRSRSLRRSARATSYPASLPTRHYEAGTLYGSSGHFLNFAVA